MTRDAKDLIVGLDIGTSKIVAIVAEMRADGHYEIVGLGQHDSKGLKKGVVVNIESTVASIQQALEEAELMADCKIRTVYTGIAGSHIRSFNSSGMVAIKDKEVTEADMARVIETAKAVNIPTDQQIVHVLPQEFIIDGGTSDIAIFTGGAIRHTAVIPIAGDQITNDIAMALRTPTPEADDIKLRFGIAKQVLADPNEKIEVPGLGDRAPRTLSRQALAAVIEPRIEELFSFVHQVIRESGYEELLSSGVVLTGGSALLPGMVELAEDIFLKPVRIGMPDYTGGLADVVRSPRYSTAVGLLEEARLQRLRGRKVAEQSGSFKETLRRMKEWFLGNF